MIAAWQSEWGEMSLSIPARLAGRRTVRPAACRSSRLPSVRARSGPWGEGKLCIRGLRITVETLVGLVAAGWPFEQILEQYPRLHEEDLREALRFAAANLDQRVVPLDQTA